MRLTTTAAFVFVFAGSAMAQTTPTVTTPTVTTPSVTTPQNVVEASRASQARANIEAMDKNGDGKISRDEWKGSTEVFNRLDANHDGFITPDERPKIERPAAGQTTGTRGQAPASQTKDTNKDGKIEKDEWKGRPAVFNRLDANHDGAIEKGEPRAAAASRGRRR